MCRPEGQGTMILETSFRGRLLAGAAFGVLAAMQSAAQAAPAKHHRHHVDSISARLDRLEQVIEAQQAEIHRLKNQVGATQVAAGSGGATQPQAPDVSDSEVQQLQAEEDDLKRSQAAQYADIQSQRQSDVQTTFKNGRPTFKTADGNFSASLRALVQYDSAY